jgi:ribose transport system permease protein
VSVAAPPRETVGAGPVDRARQLLVDRPLILLGAILVLLIAACVVVKASYFSTGQAGAILRYAAPLAIMGAGQTLVMLVRGIDLSMGATATASAYVMASHTDNGIVVAILVGLAVGALVGLINGVGVGIFGVQPLIMSLGMASIITGLLTVQASGAQNSANVVPGFIRKLGGEGLVGFVPNSLVLWVVISVLVVLLLRRTGFGRMLYAYGNNPTAMRMAGLRSWQLLVTTYLMCGLLASVAGLVVAGLLNSATLGTADSFLLPSIAAAVIGGTSIFGGIGTYGGTLMGAIILTVLDSFLVLLNAADSVRQILYGLIILLLVTIYARIQRKA